VRATREEPMDPDVFNIDDTVPTSRLPRSRRAGRLFADPIRHPCVDRIPPEVRAGSSAPDRTVLRLAALTEDPAHGSGATPAAPTMRPPGRAVAASPAAAVAAAWSAPSDGPQVEELVRL